jgi:hypothetical protein
MLPFGHLLLILGMLSCGPASVRQPGGYIEVLQATSQAWIAGARGGGRTVTYRLRIRVITDHPVGFDSLWVAGKRLPLEPEKGSPSPPQKAARNEVVTLIASDFVGPRNERDVTGPRTHPPRTDSAKAPVAHEGAALLKYHVSGTPKYEAVPAIAVLPRVHGQ